MRPFAVILGVCCACTGAIWNAGGAHNGAAERRFAVDSLCVIVDGALKNVPATVTATGDTLVGGTDYRSVYPPTTPTYAGGTEWFTNKERIFFEGHMYVVYGLPRQDLTTELRRVGEYRGTPVFGLNLPHPEPFPDVILVPVQPGCVFQLYSSRS